MVGFAPGPVPAGDGSDGGGELQWNYGLEPSRKRLKEQDFLVNNSQISSVDFFNQARSVSTGLGLSLDNGRLASSGDSPFLGLVISDEIDRELQRQDAEIDRFLKVQVWNCINVDSSFSILELDIWGFVSGYCLYFCLFSMTPLIQKFIVMFYPHGYMFCLYVCLLGFASYLLL